MGKVRLPGWRVPPADAARVIQLRADGYSVATLAIRYGRSEDWVRDVLRAGAPPVREAPLAMAPASL